MRKIIFLLCITCACYSNAQVSDSAMARLGADIQKGRAELDSVNKAMDTLFKVKENEQVRQEAERNASALAALMKERNDREKKQAITNIIIGISFAILLVIGLLRRRKKKTR